MKTLDQTADQSRTVARLRALANPVRFRIVQLLAARGTCVAGDLVEAFPLAQSTVSEHLAVLKAAGIVQGTIDGPHRCYCLDPAAMRTLADTFLALAQEPSCCP